MFVSNTPALEMENSKLAITGTLIINTMVLVLFSFIAPLRADNAKSKPLVGFFGLFSATLATVNTPAMIAKEHIFIFLGGE